MAATIAELRARARQHEEEMVSVRWFTVAALAVRWGLSETTVRLIPFSELRYKEFGKPGAKIHRRRYKEAWVLAYEESTGQSPKAADV